MNGEDAAPAVARRRLLFLVGPGLALLAAFAIRPPPTPAPRRTLTVAAASDLQPVFAELAPAFERESGFRPVFSYGSTGTLARQIEHGAPFDLFFAANESFVARLESRGLVVPGSRRVYAVGRLVLASGEESGTDVRDLRGLLDPRVKRVAIAHPEHAPYGAAARESLRQAGLWDRVRPKLVIAQNVRQAMQLVRSGNAEAGLLARSVARAPGLRSVPIDPRLHAPLRQTAALVRGSPHLDPARRFLEYVADGPGRAVLERHGLQPTPGS